MSSTTYIQLDSTYRNRTQYPLPSSYVVPIDIGSSAFSTPSAITAQDPISEAFPTLLFSGESANRLAELFNGGTFTSPVLNTAASNEDGFYNGYTITDTTLGESRTILSYVGSTQAVILDHPFSSTWAATDTYTITDPSTAAVVQLQADASLVDNFYNNMLIKDETINEFRRIVSYIGQTRTATLESSFSGAWAVSDSYSIRGAMSDEQGAVVASSALSVTLPATSSSVDNFYQGKFIYFSTGAASGSVRTIASYTGSTRSATVTPALVPAPAPGDIYEILLFSRDNSQQLNYSGSVLSQQETTNYEVELVSIDIPNLPVTVSHGARLAFYPYVYVELTNDTASSGHNRNIIYSNNPNSIRSTFVASVTDVSNDLTSQFLSLSSNGMKQTMRFKPNDNLRFSVKLPDGSLFNVGPDTVSPSIPDASIQISAVFGIRRI